MTITYKAACIFIVLATSIVTFAIVYNRHDDSKKAQLSVAFVETEQKTPVAITSSTIKSVWTWNDANKEFLTQPPIEKNQTHASMIFDVKKIHDALSTIKLDSYGDIIVDDSALGALNQAFQYGQISLNDDTMSKFQSIIHAALPDHTGDQVAEIVKNYHDYLQARTDLFASISIEDQQSGIEELIALQSLYLGNKTANDLFSVENANAHYMMSAMILEQNKSLTAQEKEDQQELLIEQYAGDQYDIENWTSRYQQFKSEKRIIEESGYSQEETKRQIDELLNYHFNKNEQERLAQLNPWH